LLACTPTTPPKDPEPEPAEPPTLEPEAAINRADGQVLDVVLPTIGGESVPLRSLAGKVVVLELSASWEPSWAEGHAFLVELRSRYPPDHLALFVVAHDPEQRALEGAEQTLEGVATIGWDPQGALAAQLTVAGFPTFVVVGKKGTIVAVERGFDESVAERLRSAIERASRDAGQPP
jgi:hypothetical protein